MMTNWHTHCLGSVEVCVIDSNIKFFKLHIFIIFYKEIL